MQARHTAKVYCICECSTPTEVTMYTSVCACCYWWSMSEEREAAWEDGQV